MERFKFDLQRFVSVVTLPSGDNRYENKTSEVRISAANGNDLVINVGGGETLPEDVADLTTVIFRAGRQQQS